MSDDLLQALGELAREQEAQADAADRGDGLDAPLDEAARGRITDALLKQVAAEAVVEAAEAPAPEPPQAKVLQFPRRRLFAGAGMALAAAAALVVLIRPADSSLPDYGLSLHAGEKQLRGDSPTETLPTIYPDSRLELVLRPATAPQSPVEAAAFVGQGERIEAWPVSIAASPTGSFRIQGTAGSLLGARRGALELILVVAPAGQLPEAQALSQKDGPFRRVSTRVKLEDPR